MGKIIRIDLNGLEPPEPMIQILSALNDLGADDILEAVHFREPVPLYAHLEEAGFEHKIEQLGEARYRLSIWKKK
ncbi:MAG: DUF2249 domain-containing protein [Elusimicrobiota bacterium]